MSLILLQFFLFLWIGYVMTGFIISLVILGWLIGSCVVEFWKRDVLLYKIKPLVLILAYSLSLQHMLVSLS